MLSATIIPQLPRAPMERWGAGKGRWGEPAMATRLRAQTLPPPSRRNRGKMKVSAAGPGGAAPSAREPNGAERLREEVTMATRAGRARAYGKRAGLGATLEASPQQRLPSVAALAAEEGQPSDGQQAQCAGLGDFEKVRRTG